MKINNLEISSFAPVVIPTLCRDKHFIALLESLAQCRYANETEVFVAVDFPAKPAHAPGHRRICDYLDGVGNMTFKKLHVIKRERNYGFGKRGNARLLIDDILQKFDRYIYTEDDNCFAPGFLEFINYNLERYKDDKSILGICGYQYPVDLQIDKPQILKLEQFSAWGYGIWKERRQIINCARENTEEQRQILNNREYRKYTLAHRPNLFTELLGMSNGEPILGDSFNSSLQIAKGLKSIFPSKSLVRNCGWDGSGTHGGVLTHYQLQEIDSESSIVDYIDATPEESLRIDSVIYNYHQNNIAAVQHILTWLTIRIYHVTGKYYNFNYFRKLWKKLRR